MSWNIINIIFAEYLMSKSDCVCRNYAVKHLLDNMINTLQMSSPLNFAIWTKRSKFKPKDQIIHNKWHWHCNCFTWILTINTQRKAQMIYCNCGLFFSPAVDLQADENGQLHEVCPLPAVPELHAVLCGGSSSSQRWNPGAQKQNVQKECNAT